VVAEAGDVMLVDKLQFLLGTMMCGGAIECPNEGRLDIRNYCREFSTILKDLCSTTYAFN
jgi:hypothetical protein